MKRLTYISKASPLLPLSEIQSIGNVATHNNQRDKITGILVCLNCLFFQVIEGEDEPIDKLYEKIIKDERHTDILCLKTEYHITERKFPNWAMKTINLDEYSDVLIQPIKSLLQTVTESYRVLEKYTQPSLFRIINSGINPLTIQPRSVEKIIFFSDILSFSTLTEKLPVTEVAALVNCYFTICSQIIATHGGEVTKFIGDCVMASFAQEQADAALASSLEILYELKKLRDNAGTYSPLGLLYTGIGLAYGTVIEGNFGSTVKMDYSLLGDAVNVAARLEALTRHLPYTLALTVEVKNNCQNPWPFIKLGKHETKGKQHLVEVYSLEEEIVQKPGEATVIAQFISQALEKIQR